MQTPIRSEHQLPVSQEVILPSEQVAHISAGEQHRLIDVLDRLSGGMPITPELALERISVMTDEQFKSLLLGINGRIRRLPPTERAFDGTGVVGNTLEIHGKSINYEIYTPPEVEDRLPLMLDVFHAIRHVKSPAVAGIMLNLGVNLTHIADDGNGRTGRILQTILTEGYDGSTAAKARYEQILQNESGRKHMSIQVADVCDALIPEYANRATREIAQQADHPVWWPPESVKGSTLLENKFWPRPQLFDPTYWLDKQPLSVETRAKFKAMMENAPPQFRDIATFQWLVRTDQANAKFIGYSEWASATQIAYGTLLLERGITEAEAVEMCTLYRDAKRGFVGYVMREVMECYGENEALARSQLPAMPAA